MNHTSGDKNNISGQDLIALVIYEITARSLFNIVYFKMMMIMLSVNVILDLLGNLVTVKEKLLSPFRVGIHTIKTPHFSDG